jgi:hypothetical protein|tara:strand:- start:524 stop:640 length:117 start_codon:yes stop_codon:yes gene_type:complete
MNINLSLLLPILLLALAVIAPLLFFLKTKSSKNNPKKW